MATAPLDELSTDMLSKPVVSERHSSIKVTKRNDQSFYTWVLQLLIRRIRGLLLKENESHTLGSIKLHPNKIVLKTCTFSERKVSDIYIYDIFPKHTPKDKFTTRIYYFCGGGWQSPPSSQHWQLAAKLARDMPGTMISIVSYPLAPTNSASSAIPMLLKLYRQLLKDSEADGHRLVFAGDSSGANIVACLILEALREDADEKSLLEGEGKHIAQPTDIMLICPSTDLTRANPDIEKLAKVDPLLQPKFVKATAKAWLGDWEATDSRVSPINGDVSLFAKRGIRVHGVTGGYDILSPDGIIFRDQCANAGVSGEWLHWEKQMHCFVLTWPYGLHEGREGVGWMIDVLKQK